MTHEADAWWEPGSYVELRTGALAHYVEAGPADGPPVMLLHGGLPGSSGAAGWRFMLPALGAAGFHVVAPDRPGFGRADTRPGARRSQPLNLASGVLRRPVESVGYSRVERAGDRK